jgi:hypothetical protein
VVRLVDLEIGSNLYCNTNGTVIVEGVPQLIVSLKQPEGPPIVNFVTFDDVGRVTSKMIESTMQFNEQRAFELVKTPTSLKLTHTESGKVVLHLEVKAPNYVVIKEANFITAKGHVLEASLIEWRVGKTRKSGEKSDLNGEPVTIG